MIEINKNEPTELTREQIIRQFALSVAMQQVTPATGNNERTVSELIKAADRIADWVRGAP